MAGTRKAKVPVFLRKLHVRYKRVKAKDSVSGTKISGPETVVRLFQDLQDETKEKLILINLDGANKILCFEVVAIGGTNACHARPVEVFTSSFLTRATSAIIIHNHPSGDPKPSVQDKLFTKNLHKASQIIGLRLLDHIIIGSEGFYSFAQAGKLGLAL